MASMPSAKLSSNHILIEIDASSGNATRSYVLRPGRSSEFNASKLNSHQPTAERGVPTLRLTELHRATDSSSTSDSKIQTSLLSSTNLPSQRVSSLRYYEALKTYLSTLFLPTGYPHTVTPDYTPYQIYDSLQAFASSIAGLLSSRAVLQSLNVLDSTSSATTTATAATLLSIVQSTLSNLTTILFASHAAPRINAEVKYYRFLADIVNDAAFILDLLAPSLPSSFALITEPYQSFQWMVSTIVLIMIAILTLAMRHVSQSFQSNGSRIMTVLFTSAIFLASDNITPSWMIPYFPSPRTVVLCLASVLRAMCGVAGGSSKAVLSAHFAQNNPENIGDLNAKDGSQETVIGLLGMWVGGVVVSRVEGRGATWLWMICLLGTHLWCNWKAVRSIRLRSLNRERAYMVCTAVVNKNRNWIKQVTADEIGAKESVLSLWTASGITWRWKLGVSVDDLLRSISGENQYRYAEDQKSGNPEAKLSELLRIFHKEKYILWYKPKSKSAAIALKAEAQPIDQFKAWLHTYTIHSSRESSEETSDCTLIEKTLAHVNDSWNEVCDTLTNAGWDLDSTSLEEVKGLRLRIEGD